MNPKKIAPWKCDGLRISVRGSTFHATGTLRVGQASERIRESLKVAAVKGNKSQAEKETRALAQRVRSELGGGVPRKAVSTLVAERFKAHIGPTDRRILQEFTTEFTTRILWDIPPETIIAFVESRQIENSAETRERYISAVCAFLNLQIAKGQYPALPAFKRDQKARNPLKRKRRDVPNFRKELLEDIIVESHISLRAQLNVEYAAGTRVSSLLQGCSLGDLDMTTLTLTFRDTKNGDDVPAALPSAMR
ncbi:MAG TPA: hypothetical protein VGL17_04765, partial [Gemmatimonadaceae bacterium]